MARPRITRLTSRKNAGVLVPVGAGSNVPNIASGVNNNAPAMAIYANTGAVVGSPLDTGNGSPPGMNDAKVVEWVTQRAIAGLTFGWGPGPAMGFGASGYNNTDGSLPPPAPVTVSQDWYWESNKPKWGAGGALNRTWWQRCAELGVKNVTIVAPTHSSSPGLAFNTTWENSATWGASTVAGALTPTAGSRLADFTNYCKTIYAAGFRGIWFDPEGDTHPFKTNYQGMPAGMSIATARSWIKLRGAQLEKVFSTYVPGGEFLFYYSRGADTLNELSFIQVTGGSQGLDPFEQNAYDSFCAGLASGVTRVTVTDETYYRGVAGFAVGIGSETADGHYNATMFNWNGRNARQSKALIVPEGDAERLKVLRNNKNAYFIWPTESGGGGGEGWSQSFADNTVPILIRESVRWSQNFHAMYVQKLDDRTTPHMDHNAFESAWQTYLVPGAAQTTHPTGSITHINGVANPGATTFSTPAASVAVSVTAADDFAIDRIEWATDRAVATTAGAPPMNFVIDSAWDVLNASILPKNTALGRAAWHMTATTEAIAVLPGVNAITITVVNIHGLTTVIPLAVTYAPSFDFTGTNGSVPAGWTPVAGTVDIQSNKMRTQTAATALAVAGAYLTSTLPYQDYLLAGEDTITTVTAGDFYGCINLRATGLTFTEFRQHNSWHLRWVGASGAAELYRIDGAGAQTFLTSGASAGFVQGSILRWEVQVVGQNFKARYWKNAETKPQGWQIDFPDPSAPTGNRVSVFNQNGGGAGATTADRIDRDNYTITDLTTTGGGGGGGSNPSGVAPPSGNIAGWNLALVEDFNTDTPLGSWGPLGANVPAPYTGKFDLYEDGWMDTQGSPGGNNGPSRYYPTKVLSTSSSMLRKYEHVENIGGVNRPVSAAFVVTPPGGTDSLGWRTTICARMAAVAGFKVAWLLWPGSENWPNDGEIDFPEASLNADLEGYVHLQGATVGSDQDAYSSGLALAPGWHVYTVEWIAGTSVKFYRDGVLLHTVTSRVPSTPMHWVVQTECNIGGYQPQIGVDAGYVEIDWLAMFTPA